eukprot:COSAG05_NODE_915_length_6628_cov_1.974269_2_plen_454_part_00
MSADEQPELEPEPETEVFAQAAAEAEQIVNEAEEGVPPEDWDLAFGVSLMEVCTQDTTSHAPKDKVEALAEAAMEMEGDHAEQVAVWIGERLGHEAVPVKLKTLQLCALFLDVGSEDLVAYMAKAAGHLIRQLVDFNHEDPEYGDRPAAMIRSTASSVYSKVPGAEPLEAAAAAAEPPAPASSAADSSSEPAMYARGSVLTGDGDGEDLFVKALRNRKMKQQAEALGSKSKISVKSGLKGFAKDMYDSTYLCSKHWRVTVPNTSGGGGGSGEVVHFVTARHAGDNLIALLNGEVVKEWRNDEQLKLLWKNGPGMEADFSFTMPGGLGGSLACTRVGTNLYDYALTMPGQVMDLSEHWLTATISLDTIFVRKATVESKDSSDAFILYEVQTFLRSAPRASGHPGFITRKRFSEFDELHKLIKSSFSAKLAQAKKFQVRLGPHSPYLFTARSARF